MSFILKDLSVIIVNYRCWDRLSQCLDSLSAIPETRLTFEVIVVDNASKDGQLNEFRKLYPQYNFISNQGNWGFASGNNLGASIAVGNYLLFLNPDTIVSEKALSAMLGQAKISHKYSIITCRQVRESGAEDKPYGMFPTLSNLTGWMRALARIAKKHGDVAEDEYFKFPDWVSGSVILMNRMSFIKVGKWSEQFWMYSEDVDLCRKARDAGGEILLLKSVSVIHNHGGSSRLNAGITALTKAEVNISKHVYISLHEHGIKEMLMHTFLIFNNLVLGLLPAVSGLILFFNRRALNAVRVYLRLMSYYFGAMMSVTWISPRSVIRSYLSGKKSDRDLILLADDNGKRA